MELPDLPDYAAVDFPYTFVLLNWNPFGHGPPGGPYDGAPHFDAHFYTRTFEDRSMVMGAVNGVDQCTNPVTGELEDSFVTCRDFESSMSLDPVEQLPPTYTIINANEPGMGNHMIDFINSPEWNGQEFDKTFIWGHFWGSIGFVEPMITLDFILSVKEGTAEPGPYSIASAPACMGRNRGGLYPTKYNVRYDKKSDMYSISLNKLEEIPSCEVVY
mmetsp:Transcript_6708/g.17260  ORF Transcript_6708/g.17260 Transcript_6708/m.17260 type:complete len:216 (-) Transcript_6708:182-829(-)